MERAILQRLDILTLGDDVGLRGSLSRLLAGRGYRDFAALNASNLVDLRVLFVLVHVRHIVSGAVPRGIANLRPHHVRERVALCYQWLFIALFLLEDFAVFDGQSVIELRPLEYLCRRVERLGPCALILVSEIVAEGSRLVWNAADHEAWGHRDILPANILLAYHVRHLRRLLICNLVRDSLIESYVHLFLHLLDGFLLGSWRFLRIGRAVTEAFGLGV